MAYRSKSPSIVLIATSTLYVARRWSQSLKEDFVTQGVEDLAALELVLAQLKPPVLLLDLSLLRNGRTRRIGSLQRLSVATKIIAFTRTPNDAEGISVLMSGAKGYCPRSIKPALLKKAVTLVRRGEIWAGRKLIHLLIEKLMSHVERRQKRSATEVDGPFDALTCRQREIAGLIGRGARNKEIASQIHMSEKTVKAHLTAIFRKVGVSNRFRLALFVNEHSQLEHQLLTRQTFNQTMIGLAGPKES